VGHWSVGGGGIGGYMYGYMRVVVGGLKGSGLEE
jgi:hypothetical protein